MAVSVNRNTKELRYGRSADGLAPAEWVIMRTYPIKPDDPNYPGDPDDPDARPIVKEPDGIQDIRDLVDAKVPNRYWDIDETDPKEPRFAEMDQAGKDAADTAAVVRDRQAMRAKLRNGVNAYLANKYPDAESQQLLEVLSVAQGKPDRQAMIRSVFTWKESVLAAAVDKLDEINAAPFPMRVAPLDLAAFDATDPQVTIKAVIRTTT